LPKASGEERVIERVLSAHKTVLDGFCCIYSVLEMPIQR
jgi:hypothetical protein